MWSGCSVVEDAVLSSGYSVDFLLSRDGRQNTIESFDGPNIAIEVDGPSHFLYASTLPRGETLMKRRHLTSSGLEVVSIPYWDWAALESKSTFDKCGYVRQRLQPL